MTAERACAVCGSSLDGLRSDARYCGGTCRNAAYEARLEQGTNQASYPSVAVRGGLSIDSVGRFWAGYRAIRRRGRRR